MTSENEFPWSLLVRVAEMGGRKTNRYTIEPDATQRAALASDLGLEELHKLRFTAELTPLGKRDWALAGQLGATVKQICVVTGGPVSTRIDEKVTRRYLSEMPEIVISESGGSEMEMPEDETAEELPAVIDLGALMAEELALALPLYPRAPGAELAQTAFAQPGVAPMTEEETKPFAGLKALRDKLEKDN
ncbi:MAG: YceD family protein [Paracoccaceae bacterium]